MSVMCQNFVQNAWKKDLCSNCFKSVGDHEGEVGVGNAHLSHQNENMVSRTVNHTTNGHSSISNGTAHTTWKSLISERNQKNSQPFKLENGFQGRLLTINKSSEKKTTPEMNGDSGNINQVEPACKESLQQNKLQAKTTVNGFRTAIKTESSGQIHNGFSNKIESKIHFNGVKSMLNEIESKNDNSQNKQCKNAGSKPTAKIPNEGDYQILSKCNNEDRCLSPLQGILKKKVASVNTKPPQTRRGSNVGFKDEEPLVIGYGGRDFSPEELEWDMNTSDGEFETGSDSLDETEDDRVFSKMTKANTEFNSDNSNLLAKQQSEAEKIKRNNEKPAQNSTENKDSKPKSPAQSNKSMKETESDKSDSIEINLNGEKTTSSEKKLSDENHFINKPIQDNESAKVDVKDWEMRNGKIDVGKDKESINVAIKNSERDRAVTSGESVVVEAAKKNCLPPKEEDKNSPVRGSEDTLSLTSPTISGRNIEGDSETERPEHSAMFSSENGISKETENTAEEENNEWQEGNDLAGEILQAINTSLTNRHKMNAENETEIEFGVESQLENGEKNAVQLDNVQPSMNENITVSMCDISPEKKDCDAKKVLENAVPRPSFLHGRVTNCKAIYGPASDLFVSRSNSSSSSSSDECGKSEVAHSISVTVNGKNAHKPIHKPVVRSASEEILNITVPQVPSLTDYETDSSISSNFKPRISAKPNKRSCSQEVQIGFGHYPKPSPEILKPPKSERRKSDGNMKQNGTYYSVSNSSTSEGTNTITLVDHYAEGNIYHEVILDSEESRNQCLEENENMQPKRETKLAALAIELEQARHSGNNTKRQAPAPPKIPDPPLEDPPSSSGRISPSGLDSPHGFSSFRGEAMAFSSSSSAASTSSQDTETGYASWNLHGDAEEKRKHSKSKSSFLLAQYSKCKMLAMGYAEDNSKSRKKFSIKKLLKIRKDGSTDSNAAFDPSCPNPKAWKYSDHFERPRAKLEIIHPMDLENKSVAVNPGFDSLHSGSFSSFTASTDDLSLRNSVSSDYGSFYSDTVSPTQDIKPESNYECLESCRLQELEDNEDSEDRIETTNSDSPTPSRTSNTSQASTLTADSSKNDSTQPNRPPKPPPPPRAHSLLPRKPPHNPDGTFKFPVGENNTSSSDENSSKSTTKPQAPKRQCKSSASKPECDNNGIVPNSSDIAQTEEEIVLKDSNTDIPDTPKECPGITVDIKANVSSNNQQENTDPPVECCSPKPALNEPQVSVLSLKPDTQTINVTVKNTLPEREKPTKSAVTRNKHSPITKAPSRPPPIYMKPQLNIVARNPHPWKTLEDSYLVLTVSNRELLGKLVTQALKKRKVFTSQLQKLHFRWADFEIDLAQPSSIFAFGEKIAYHATMPDHPNYVITLVITVQQAQCRLSENHELKYPVFGQFVDSIPPELLDSSGDSELESMQATILVLDRSNITTIECFTDNLPNPLTDQYEKELSFIMLQLIHSLKSLQAQGIESVDSSFQNLILAKTKGDKYNTLIFLTDGCYEDGDYISESCRTSLCQYALMLLLQLLGIQSVEEFVLQSDTKFSSEMSKKTFEAAISLLSEEKAVSLSQTKILMECFFWELTKVLETFEETDDIDGVLQRWMDIKRSNFIKNIVNDESVCDINVQSEYYSQFLIRTSIRNVKEILFYL